MLVKPSPTWDRPSKPFGRKNNRCTALCQQEFTQNSTWSWKSRRLTIRISPHRWCLRVCLIKRRRTIFFHETEKHNEFYHRIFCFSWLWHITGGRAMDKGMCMFNSLDHFHSNIHSQIEDENEPNRNLLCALIIALWHMMSRRFSWWFADKIWLTGLMMPSLIPPFEKLPDTAHPVT